MAILPEKVDKHKKGKNVEPSMPMATIILPEKVDKWFNHKKKAERQQ